MEIFKKKKKFLFYHCIQNNKKKYFLTWKNYILDKKLQYKTIKFILLNIFSKYYYLEYYKKWFNFSKKNFENQKKKKNQKIFQIFQNFLKKKKFQIFKIWYNLYKKKKNKNITKKNSIKNE